MRTPAFGPFVVLALLAGLGGCLFTSENPLPKRLEIDRDLLGWWRVASGDPKDQPGNLLVLEDRDGTLQLIVTEGDYRASETYHGFCSEIQGEKFLNVRRLTLDPATGTAALAPDYYLVHYRLTGGPRLELSLLNQDLFVQAVKKGRLQGRLSETGNDLVLTDSPEHLATFIRKRKRKDLLGTALAPAVRIKDLP